MKREQEHVEEIVERVYADAPDEEQTGGESDA